MADVLLIGAEELENLGTRYLAAVLRQHGHQVDLAAFSTPEDTDTVLWRAKLTQPRLVGLSLIFQYRAPQFLALAAELRDILPYAHITMGGHFPTFAAMELLRDFPVLDSVVRGEGEFTLLELVENLDAPAAWDDILGLSFRTADRLAHNPPCPLIPELDTLPFPVRDTPPQHHLGIGYTPILGSRGCYRDCAFCSIRSFYGSSRGRTQRFRSVSNLVDEMETLYHRFGVRFFVFNDDEWFPAGEARYAHVSALESELGQRRLRVIMSIKCRADDVEGDLFHRLFDMGVVRVYIGVESGSDHSLKRMNKHSTVAQNRHALEVLRQVDMLADFGLILFDPDSTVEDIRANLGFLRDMGGEGQAPLSFGRMEIYAGTPILDRLQREGRLTGDYLAWNHTTRDPRVEMLWRLMYTTTRHRHYDNDGLGKQCSVACYELMIHKHLNTDCYDPALGERLRDIVARVNNHSLDVFGQMFNFTLSEDIHDPALVNDRATIWASKINLFDLEVEAELLDWKEQVALRVKEPRERGQAGGTNAAFKSRVAVLGL